MDTKFAHIPNDKSKGRLFIDDIVKSRTVVEFISGKGHA